MFINIKNNQLIIDVESDDEGQYCYDLTSVLEEYRKNPTVAQRTGLNAYSSGKNYENLITYILNHPEHHLHDQLMNDFGWEYVMHAINIEENIKADLKVFGLDIMGEDVEKTITVKNHLNGGHLAIFKCFKLFLNYFKKAYPAFMIDYETEKILCQGFNMMLAYDPISQQLKDKKYSTGFKGLPFEHQKVMIWFLYNYFVEVIQFLYFYDKDDNSWVDALIFNNTSEQFNIEDEKTFCPFYIEREEMENKLRFIKSKYPDNIIATYGNYGFFRLFCVNLGWSGSSEPRKNKFRPSIFLSLLSEFINSNDISWQKPQKGEYIKIRDYIF